MKRSTKAALLSALIFPGVGQFSLRRYTMGFLLTGAALASLYFIVSYAVERAFQIVDKIQQGEIAADSLSITELVSQQSMQGGAQFLNIASLVLIVCWLISIVDAIIAGRRHDESSN